MSKLEAYLEQLDDDQFEIAFEVVQCLYGMMLDTFNQRVNERVEHADVQIKLHERGER